jgi:hypothetical protein
MTGAIGYAGDVAAAGPWFLAFLIPHILAGTAAVASGVTVIHGRKDSRRHVRAGTVYYWALAALAATAAGLTAVRGTRDLYLLVLGVLAFSLASAGRHAWRQPLAWPWRAWPGHGPHILAMSASYTVMATAFLADNGKDLPLIGHLPKAVFWLLPAAIAAPVIARALHRHTAQAAGPDQTAKVGRAAEVGRSAEGDQTAGAGRGAGAGRAAVIRPAAAAGTHTETRRHA